MSDSETKSMTRVTDDAQINDGHGYEARLDWKDRWPTFGPIAGFERRLPELVASHDGNASQDACSPEGRLSTHDGMADGGSEQRGGRGADQSGHISEAGKVQRVYRREPCPPFRNQDGSWSVPLTAGRFAIVDKEDVDLVRQQLWRVHKSSHTNYVINSKHQYMHRVILCAKAGQIIDHVDGNGLNNRRTNIRICTEQQNQANRRPGSKLTKFKGVKVFVGKNRFSAHIKVDGKQIFLGGFQLESDAARAYDEAAKRHFGEFARLNFPDHLQNRIVIAMQDAEEKR